MWFSKRRKEADLLIQYNAVLNQIVNGQKEKFEELQKDQEVCRQPVVYYCGKWSIVQNADGIKIESSHDAAAVKQNQPKATAYAKYQVFFPEKQLRNHSKHNSFCT